MSKRFASLFAALVLATGLMAPNAFAQLSLMAGPAATGTPGGPPVSISLAISGSAEPGDPDLSKIAAYTFVFDWGVAPLSFAGLSGFNPPDGQTTDIYSSYAVVTWTSLDSNLPWIDFTSFSLSAKFSIKPGATTGDYFISVASDGFPTGLTDIDGHESVFSSTANTPMQVTVEQAVTPVPEPAEVSMLLAGLGLMAAVIRRRKSRQA